MLTALLCVLVVVELALNAVDGTMKAWTIDQSRSCKSGSRRVSVNVPASASKISAIVPAISSLSGVAAYPARRKRSRARRAEACETPRRWATRCVRVLGSSLCVMAVSICQGPRTARGFGDPSARSGGPEPRCASAARGRRTGGRGYFVWRCKGASAPAENSHAGLLQACSASGQIALEGARARAFVRSGDSSN